MSLNLRYPNITGMSEKEQIAQIKSFLHQLVDQLNYAPMSGGGEASQTYQVQGAEVSYYELRSLIMHDLQQLETKFGALSEKMEDGYVPKSGWDANKDIITDDKGNVVVAPRAARWDLLWENPEAHPTQCEEMDVGIQSLSDYGFVVIVHVTDDSSMHNSMIVVDEENYYMQFLTIAGYARSVQASGEPGRLSALCFGQCKETSSGSAANNACIPVKIYGITKE